LKHYREYDKASIRTIIESGLKRDLHMHTHYSDGSLTPEEMIDLKRSEGYELISITDHDGTEGSEIGMKYADKVGISYISGIEFDTHNELGRDMHMLGYGFDFDNPRLREVLLEIRIKRARRNDRMMKALNKLGYEISLDDIGTVNEGRYVGKPTFALLLCRKGYIDSPDIAFNTIFREPDLREVRKETLPSSDAIDLIHEAGGLAVLAHPMEHRHLLESFEDYKPRMYRLLDMMRDCGIDGVECYHPSANEEQQELLVDYADKYGLMITEGSDTHSPSQVRDYSRYHRP